MATFSMPTRKMIPTPTYFQSAGGPSLIENHDYPAYVKLPEIGRGITTHAKPKAVIVFSAYWQAGAEIIVINTAIT